GDWSSDVCSSDLVWASVLVGDRVHAFSTTPAFFAGVEMAQSKHEKNVQPSMLARTEDIQQQIQELSGRDLQLWSIGILIMLVLTAGLLALVLPNLVWAQRVIRVEQAYLPQLFFGLISDRKSTRLNS